MASFATALLALVLAGCGEDRTEIFVVVDSDLSVPDELSELRIEVTTPGPRPETRTSVATLAPTGDEALPRTLGLLHEGGELGPFEIRAVGLLRGVVRVDCLARVSFVPGKTLVLRMFLVRSCIGEVCGPERTCGESGCRTVDVPESELTEWNGEVPRLDAAMRPDVGPPDAGPVDSGPGDGGPGDGGDAGDAGTDAATDAGVDDVPLEVPDLVLWLRADRGVTMEVGGVSRWEDQSPDGNDFEQSIPARRPALDPAALGGEPAIEVSGGTWLSSAATVPLGGATAVTVIVVARSDDPGILVEASDDYGANPGAFAEFITATGVYAPSHFGDVGISQWQTAAVMVGRFYRFSSVHDMSLPTGEVRGFLDNAASGMLVSDGNNTGSFGDYAWHLGAQSAGGNPLDGAIAEVIVYARALAAAERDRIDGYLVARYGL